MKFSKKLLIARAKLNLNQTQLAEVLGVSLITINRLGNGKYAPTKLVKKKIELLCQENNIKMEVAR